MNHYYPIHYPFTNQLLFQKLPVIRKHSHVERIARELRNINVNAVVVIKPTKVGV